jgi:hypothetical protein
VFPDAGKARFQVVIGRKMGERVAGDDDESEPTSKREGPHVGPHECCSPHPGLFRLTAGSVQHGRRHIQADDLMPITRDRNGEPARAAGKLENWTSRTTRLFAVKRFAGPWTEREVIKLWRLALHNERKLLICLPISVEPEQVKAHVTSTLSGANSPEGTT